MRKVLELPAFRRLLAVSMIDQLAISIAAVALAVLIYRQTGSAIGATAFFLCAEFAPAFLSPPLVARLEGTPARRVISLLYAAESVIFVALALVVQRFALAPVLALVLLAGSIAVTAAVLVRATWTSAVSPSGLVREANALVNSGILACAMAGPALGGALVALGGTGTALVINAAGYGVSAVLTGTTRGLPRTSGSGRGAGGRLRAALNYVRGEPLIRRLLGLQAAGLLFFAMSIPVEVVFAEHTLHTGAGGYGVLLAAWGGGAIVGSVVYIRWRRLPSRVMMTLGACSLGVGFLVMAVAPSLSVAVVGGAVAGIGNGVELVSMRTALQEAVAEDWMALVLSLNQSIFQALPGGGIVLGGLIAASASPRAALAVAAVGSLLVALTMWAGLAKPFRASGAESRVTEPKETASALAAATHKR